MPCNSNLIQDEEKTFLQVKFTNQTLVRNHVFVTFNLKHKQPAASALSCTSEVTV